MKLYLSSYKLGRSPERLAELAGDNDAVAIIMNATDSFGPSKRAEYLAREIASLAHLGLKGYDLDLRNYFGGKAGLARVLESTGVVWAMGGNAFVLRQAMRTSGFDEIAPDLVSQNKLVYGGFSAGAVVAGSTLRGIDRVDDPTVHPEGYGSDTIWSGMSFVPWVVVPHYKSDHPDALAIEKTIAYLDIEKIAYRTLSDGEVFIIND